MYNIDMNTIYRIFIMYEKRINIYSYGGKTMKITISEEDINNAESSNLINELSEQLRSITGNDGKSSFKKEDMSNERSIFVVARDLNGEALGCGALRYYTNETAEIKRMYVRKKSSGIGSKILNFLEIKAKEFKYKKIILETRVINKRAVNFYKQNGYNTTDNYGKYVGRTEAVCFDKNI